MAITSNTRNSITPSTPSFVKLFATLTFAAILALLASHAGAQGNAGPQFSIRVAPAVRAQALTGRIFVFVSRTASPEPRLQYGGLGETIPFFGRDVSGLAAGAPTVLDATTAGYPLATIGDLPPGDYAVQALANVYTRFPRADGHVVWAHNDQGEGQQFNRSPGNLISDVMHVHIDGRRTQTIALTLGHVIPPIAAPADTDMVKHVRIQSALLTKFWGVPMYLGASVLLPKGYDTQTTRRYATVYEQGHFTNGPAFGFAPNAKPETPAARAGRLTRTNRESRYEFTQAWLNGDIPPLVGITFAHPTPYYDDSYAVNSVNNGPYGDAIMTELIPYLEAHFRLIPEGRARFLIGGSTGGWEALALQIYHPDDFNGAWGLYPDPVDFHRFQLGNMYADTTAFTIKRNDWIASEIPAQRLSDGSVFATMREESRLEFVLGSHGRSTEQFNAWDATYGPITPDGYPAEMWDKHTGVINRSVIAYMHDNGFDLEAYLEKSWSTIGPKLTGKLHVDVGDDDDFFLNLACYRLQTFLDAQTAPPAHAVFNYGRPLKPHGYQAHTTADYLREMATRAGT